jgi:DNA-binding transcriptional ArsR family regulator
MSTLVDTMASPRFEPGLIPRLERLTGEAARGCVPAYAEAANEIARAREFARALGRARALSDEHRLLAVALLRRKGKLCACELQAALGVTHATISHHMAVLEKAGFVRSERDKKWRYYRLADDRGVEVP